MGSFGVVEVDLFADIPFDLEASWKPSLWVIINATWLSNSSFAVKPLANLSFVLCREHGCLRSRFRCLSRMLHHSAL